MMSWFFATVILILVPFRVTAELLDSVVAVVNQEVITASEVNNHLENLRKQMLGASHQPPKDAVLRKQVIQHLIDVYLQLQIAKQNNITIDSAELNDALNKIALKNKLSLSELRLAVESQGLNWQTYRGDIRKEIIISRLQQKAVGKEIVISPGQIEEYLKSQEHIDRSKFIYQLQNIVIQLPEEPTPKQVSNANIKADEILKKIKQGEDFSQLAITESSGEFAVDGGDLGERHLAELPEVFVPYVVRLKPGEVAGPIRTGNGIQLIKLINISQNNVRHEVMQTHVRHILLKQSASTTTAEIKKQATNLYRQLQAGKDFSNLAKRYSADVVSAVKGGDLGWVTADALVPEFEKAMNALPLHTISKPIKSAFGYHIIEVLERKTVDDTSSYERQQVKQFLQQRKFMETVQTWLQHARSTAYIKILREIA